MWQYLFVIGAWLTITPPSELVTDSTNVFLVSFSREMDVTTILDINNYSIVDNDNKSYEIYSAYLLSTLDNQIVIPESSLVALVIEKLQYRKEYTTTVFGVRDKAGTIIDTVGGNNIGWYFFNGYLPNIYEPPIVNLSH